MISAETIITRAEKYLEIDNNRTLKNDFLEKTYRSYAWSSFRKETLREISNPHVTTGTAIALMNLLQ